MRALETLLAEIAETEEKVAHLRRALAEGRVQAHALHTSEYVLHELRRQVAALEGRDHAS
jgi:hypothetical protein